MATADNVFVFPTSDLSGTSRPIQTVFYRGKKVIQINRSKWANSAVLRCINHMQLNHYEATHAEIYDNNSGVLHAVITCNVVGKITIVFRREVHEGM